MAYAIISPFSRLHEIHNYVHPSSSSIAGYLCTYLFFMLFNDNIKFMFQRVSIPITFNRFLKIVKRKKNVNIIAIVEKQSI